MDGSEERTTEVDLDVSLDRKVDLHDPEQRTDVESALRSIPGLLAVRIVPGYEREVDELHALTSLDRPPKQTVRDIQSMLMARFGVSTDHRVVSVVQLDEDVSTLTEPRVLIGRVAVTHQGLAASVRVMVSDGTNDHEGEAEGPASAPGRRRAVARAALEATRPLLGPGRVVEIEGVEVAEVLGHEVAITFVHFHSVNGENTVVGSAIVRGDENDAIARSVLDALNRAIADGR